MDTNKVLENHEKRITAIENNHENRITNLENYQEKQSNSIEKIDNKVTWIIGLIIAGMGSIIYLLLEIVLS